MIYKETSTSIHSVTVTPSYINITTKYFIYLRIYWMHYKAHVKKLRNKQGV